MADSVTAKSAVAMILAIRQKRKKKRVRKHRFWVRDWLKCRQLYGAYHQLHQELDTATFSRVSAQSIGKTIPETCQAIIETLSEDYLKVKST